MNKKNPIFLTYVLAGIALVALGFGTLAERGRRQATSEVETLQAQLASLSASVQPGMVPESIPLDAPTSVTTEVVSVSSSPSPAETPTKESWEERMQRLQEEDPERYAQIIANRTKQQEKMRYDLAGRTASFLDLDVSLMTEEERQNHELLVEKMARIWELTDQLPSPELPPDRKISHELFGAMKEVRPLMQQERSIMFKQLGADVGFEGEDADAFAAYVEEIINLTTLRSSIGRGGRGNRNSNSSDSPQR